MKKLPVIVGFGGINAAGRTSMHHGHKRMVHSALSDQAMSQTWQDLATIMGIDERHPDARKEILAGTLIRRIEEATHFNPDAVDSGKKIQLISESPVTFQTRKSKLPEFIPEHWQLREIDEKSIEITISEPLEAILPDSCRSKVSSAGQLPTGFNPGRDYNSANHPRALQMAVYGASDAIQSIGIDWQTLLASLSPDAVSVYAGSSLSQLDQYSMKGLFQSGYNGKRTTSKMMPLTFPEMSADFINSYIINSVGNTGSNAGACATFLYNLRQACIDIQANQCRVAIVGNSEAPIVPEIMEGFRVMGALAEDEELKFLDKSDQVNNQRACRPFSANAGFTIAESAQFLVLMDDALAVELGATMFGSVADVFVNADANKKSISGPGVGNYLTMAKATALAKAILADDLNNTFVMAHGTGTPQNRITESHILNEMAKTFGIQDWRVSAVKSYLGHSLGPAAGDQISAALGVWHTGYVPGIQSIDHVAADVHQSQLNILLNHDFVGDRGDTMAAALINSKGFGGNNASSLILSPQRTESLIKARHGEAAWKKWKQQNETVRMKQHDFDERACRDGVKPIYSFGESVMNENDVTITPESLSLTEFKNSIQLPNKNPYL